MDVWAFETFATDEMGQWMRKYTTPSTATVTESLVRICRGKTIRQRMLLTTEMGAYVTFSHLRKKRLASCGGMSKEIVLRSTFTKESVQGRTKKSPETPKRGGGCMFSSLFPLRNHLSVLKVISFWIFWTHEWSHDKPGPLGFLSVIRPNRKMTARSYSFTICVFET